VELVKAGEAKTLKKAVATIKKERAAADKANDEAAEAVAPAAEVKDELDQIVPAHVAPAFAIRAKARQWANQLNAIKRELAQAIADKEPGFDELERQEQRIALDLDRAKQAIKFTIPYAVCPYCKAEKVPKCDACKRRGWVHSSTYKAAPQEMRA
jgi:hypothetical protein